LYWPAHATAKFDEDDPNVIHESEEAWEKDTLDSLFEAHGERKD
jgi:hypothetical protein